MCAANSPGASYQFPVREMIRQVVYPQAEARLAERSSQVTSLARSLSMLWPIRMTGISFAGNGSRLELRRRRKADQAADGTVIPQMNCGPWNLAALAFA